MEDTTEWEIFRKFSGSGGRKQIPIFSIFFLPNIFILVEQNVCMPTYQHIPGLTAVLLSIPAGHRAQTYLH
jgi:hypothetical protein